MTFKIFETGISTGVGWLIDIVDAPGAAEVVPLCMRSSLMQISGGRMSKEV